MGWLHARSSNLGENRDDIEKALGPIKIKTLEVIRPPEPPHTTGGCSTELHEFIYQNRFFMAARATMDFGLKVQYY